MDDDRISWLEVPPLDAAPPDARAFIDAVAEARGFVPNVLRAYALQPGHLVASFSYLYDLMAPERGSLSKRERELMAVVVSVENSCLYCVVSHGAALAAASGDPVLARTVSVNYRHVALPPRERALADFAAKLTREPPGMSEADIEGLRAEGLDDRAILEAIEVVAVFNFTNRLASGLGLQPDPEYLRQF